MKKKYTSLILVAVLLSLSTTSTNTAFADTDTKNIQQEVSLRKVLAQHIIMQGYIICWIV